MVKFEALDTPKGLGELNKYLQDRSYIEGWTPSAADVEVFLQIKAAPDANKSQNVARWWNHIAFFPDNERKSWPVPKVSAAAPAADTKAAAPAANKTTAAPAAKDEDDIDLFGDDPESDAAWEAEIEKRAAEAKAKKEATGKKVILKSAVVIDVKPWDDTTDMKEVEKRVREIVMDGLEWKASKLQEVGYGIKKLSISCHIEDEKVSVDDIQEKIQEFEDLVQSTDIASFTKL